MGATRTTSQSLLIEAPTGDAISVHDYIRDADARAGEKVVPDAVWLAALNEASSAAAQRAIGATAAARATSTLPRRLGSPSPVRAIWVPWAASLHNLLIATRAGPASGPARALAEVAVELVRAGELDRAVALASAIADSVVRDAALGQLAVIIVQADDLDRAEALARTIADPYAQAQVLAGLVTPPPRPGTRTAPGGWPPMPRPSPAPSPTPTPRPRCSLAW